MKRIGDYALLGDCHSAAIVSRDGTIEWWCPRRFDSRCVFASLLDPEAGRWSVRPREAFEVERRYIRGTLVLETTFRTAAGRVRMTDALELGVGERGHAVGASSPHRLLRLLEGLEGTVRLGVEFVPRPEYGLIVPDVVRVEGGLQTVGGPDALFLAADAPFELGHGSARSDVVLFAGERRAFALEHRASLRPLPGEPIDVEGALHDTIQGWRSWSEAHSDYDGAYRGDVLQSALVLQALTYKPTGAIVAAPTTSLPEAVGEGANWDYRYAWLRDASMTLKALWVGGCPHEAHQFFEWISLAAASRRDDGAPVQIMFGVGGERDLTEHTLDHLAGFRDSRPVRVGNNAWKQRQLDVMGEVLDAAWMLRDQIGDPDPHTAAFLVDLADVAAQTWPQQDSGIWEGREGTRHYTTSKLLCWVALDRAVKLALWLGAEDRLERWTRQRDAVRGGLLDRGWSKEARTFTGAFGSVHLDAGVLLMPILGFLPAEDARMRETIDAIERDLSQDGLVRRWTDADDEGAFVICSYWLVTCRALLGETDRARELFERVTGHANDLGLLAEEIDTRDGEMLGNFPQALSHIGLIEAAWTITQAESGKGAQR